MESLENFEMIFYDGHKMVKSNDGTIQLFDADEHFIGNSPNEMTMLMWEHFQLCLRNCLTYEKTFSNLHIDGECFPIIVGRKPPIAPSHVRGVVGEIDRMLTPRTLNVKTSLTKIRLKN